MCHHKYCRSRLLSVYIDNFARRATLAHLLYFKMFWSLAILLRWPKKRPTVLSQAKGTRAAAVCLSVPHAVWLWRQPTMLVCKFLLFAVSFEPCSVWHLTALGKSLNHCGACFNLRQRESKILFHHPSPSCYWCIKTAVDFTIVGTGTSGSSRRCCNPTAVEQDCMWAHKITIYIYLHFDLIGQAWLGEGQSQLSLLTRQTECSETIREQLWM